MDEVVVYRAREGELHPEEESRPWSFTADPALFRVAAEARRIHLAYLFDSRIGIHLSKIDPLPHQITAVYTEMLPRQPLRFLLADDPGAGKTIMAGLYIKELALRGDLQRCLIVAPGGLVAQWQDELDDKFGLRFDILTRDLIEASRTGDPFGERPMLLARMDHLSRNDDLTERLAASDWDLVVVDEAHRMAAHYFGNDVTETKRYRLGKTLGAVARHFLLMTATPHAGKDEDFQLFMALLDSDRFEGKPRDGVHVADTSDLMRRMVKEKLLRFDGKPLFPERRAYTLPYELTDAEMALYREVTDYVAEEMGRADQLLKQGEGRRGNRVGFAVTVLQRRLASSPEAIFQSLARRRKRLEDRARDLKAQARGGRVLAGDGGLASKLLSAVDIDADTGESDLDDLDGEELEALEEQLVDDATNARTLAELEAEIATLERLEARADQVRQSGEDRKWNEVLGLVGDEPEMFEADGTRRKLIVFTEHRDTLNYLVRKLTAYLGRAEAVVAIHGGVAREERRVIQERFTTDAACQILVATDAAGEGLNLQRAHLLVNYDLAWNPNRIEQRFGRVHRIGQTEVCHLWNLVADETREGMVYTKLLSKLEEMRDTLGVDQVFDVLGDALPGQELRQLLIEAIRYGNEPETRAKLDRVIDERVGDGLAELVREHALTSEVISAADLERIRADMLEAQARRLQPGYVQAWFIEAFGRLGGRMAEREPGRFEITLVPADIRQRDRLIGVGVPVMARYQRVTFEKDLTRVEGKPPAELLAPGHPVLEAVIDMVAERHGPLIKEGAVLVDDADGGTDARVLVFLEHSVSDARSEASGKRRVVSRRFEFVEIPEHGELRLAGYAPYLDARPPTPDEAPLVPGLVEEMAWLAGDLAERAGDYGIEVLAAEHLAEVQAQTLERVAKVRAAVHARLTKEIGYWDHRAAELDLQAQAGKTPRMNPDRAEARAEDLRRRLHARMADLDREAQLSPQPPLVVGGALIVPAGLLRRAAGLDSPPPPAAYAVDTTVVERRAVDAVLAAETALGHSPVEMPHNHPGYDIHSTDALGQVGFIEVKGRIAGAGTFVVTQNELRFAANIPDGYLLALVEVSPDGPHADQVRYLTCPYGGEVRLPFDTTSTTLDWGAYWQRGGPPGSISLYQAL